jgi:hypothetical protein
MCEKRKGKESLPEDWCLQFKIIYPHVLRLMLFKNGLQRKRNKIDEYFSFTSCNVSVLQKQQQFCNKNNLTNHTNSVYFGPQTLGLRLFFLYS